MELEICANSIQSALNAERGGAHRIELCSELAVGGVTPSYGTIRQVVQALDIPVFVLVRPRSGNFTYTRQELAAMLDDIHMCRDLGCKGIVSGALQTGGRIDLDLTRALVEAAGELAFTFHRAFDWVSNPAESLNQLIELGVDRILTSGQESSAEKGLPLLKHLKTLAQGKISLLPGGGVSENNAHLFKEAGFSEIHASLTELDQANEAPRIPMNSGRHFSETHLATSSFSSIQQILKGLNDEK